MTDRHESPDAPRPSDESREPEGQEHDEHHRNPPRTTRGKVTAPKFGSAGSGGAELEPIKELDDN